MIYSKKLYGGKRKMKKVIALLLALMMCVSILAACGGGEEPPSTPADPPAEQDKEPEKAPEPEAKKDPEPEPAGDGRITIKSDEWGDISFIVPDNGNYELLLAEPGQDSLEVIGKELHGQRIDFPYQQMTYQKAFITGNGFDILIGYKDLLADNTHSWPTYNMMVSTWNRPNEVTYGGLNGFGYRWDFYIFAFPAITQYGIRFVHIFPHLPDGDDEFKTSQMKDLTDEIMELPEIHVILDSLEFGGEFINEPRFETEPIDGKHVTITPVDGWEFTTTEPGLAHFKLKNYSIEARSSNSSYAEIVIRTGDGSRPLKDLIEDAKGATSNKDIEQLDNIKINDQTYILFLVPNTPKYLLYTSLESGVLDLDKGGHIWIDILYLEDISSAIPMLESITLNQ